MVPVKIRLTQKVFSLMTRIISFVLVCVVALTMAVPLAEAPEATYTPVPVVAVVKKPKPVKRAVMARPRDEALCLAQALFFESGNQPFEGVEAVATVIFNRAAQTRQKPCEVIWKQTWVTMRDGTQKLIAQFSYTADGRAETMSKALKAQWLEIAKDLMAKRDILVNQYGPIDHFHTTRVTPKWKDSPQLMPVVTIGDHVFYQRVLRAKHTFSY